VEKKRESSGGITVFAARKMRHGAVRHSLKKNSQIIWKHDPGNRSPVQEAEGQVLWGEPRESLCPVRRWGIGRKRYPVSGVSIFRGSLSPDRRNADAIIQVRGGEVRGSRTRITEGGG